MALPTIPTVAEIKARIQTDIEGKIDQTTPALPKSFVKVLSGAISGVVILLYDSILWVYRQIFPETADYAALVLLGKLVGLSPTPAINAVITANVYGTNGESVAVGTNFRTASNYLYQVTTGGTISGGYALCTLTAVTPGDAPNVADGETLSILSPDVVLTGAAIVVSTTTTGADAETEASFRSRVIVRYKRRHTGGSVADYYLWALEAPHVIWASPVAGDEPLDVYIYIEVDDQADGIPTAGELTTVESYVTTDPVTGIQDRKPICDIVTALPISRKTFDVMIDIKDGTSEIKDSITAALTDYFLGLSPYNEGITLENDSAMTDTDASAVASAIAREAGASILDLVIYDADTSYQVSSYILIGGEKAKLGTATYVDRT